MQGCLNFQIVLKTDSFFKVFIMISCLIQTVRTYCAIFWIWILKKLHMTKTLLSGLVEIKSWMEQALWPTDMEATNSVHG